MLDELKRATDEIVDRMVGAGVAERYFPPEASADDGDFRLIAPESFSRDSVGIICSGYPEKTGIWAMSVLAAGSEPDASMGPYFEAFSRMKWGLIALNPHYDKPDASGTVYRKQLSETFERLLARRRGRIGIIAYSQGGKQVLEFLASSFRDPRAAVGTHVHANLEEMRFVFIDTVPPAFSGDLRDCGDLRSHLKTHSLVFSTAGEHNTGWGEATAAMLGVGARPLDLPHGMLPNAVLPHVLDYFRAWSEDASEMTREVAIHHHIDITKDKCPMTFVKVKVMLAKIGKGEILEVLLAGGEPLKNVPRSAEDHGFEVLEIRPEGQFHKVLIRK